MFKFKLDSKKAVEAAAILARQSPGQKISRKRLLALLYIANRECLKRSGRPIIGGRLVAMKYGPIHGEVYDLINQREGADGHCNERERPFLAQPDHCRHFVRIDEVDHAAGAPELAAHGKPLLL